MRGSRRSRLRLVRRGAPLAGLLLSLSLASNHRHLRGKIHASSSTRLCLRRPVPHLPAQEQRPPLQRRALGAHDAHAEEAARGSALERLEHRRVRRAPELHWHGHGGRPRDAVGERRGALNARGARAAADAQPKRVGRDDPRAAFQRRGQRRPVAAGSRGRCARVGVGEHPQVRQETRQRLR